MITSTERTADFEAGWRTAAKWAQRDDLIADIGSPAYISDMRNALWPIAIPPSNALGSVLTALRMEGWDTLADDVASALGEDKR